MSVQGGGAIRWVGTGRTRHPRHTCLPDYPVRHLVGRKTKKTRTWRNLLIRLASRGHTINRRIRLPYWDQFPHFSSTQQTHGDSRSRWPKQQRLYGKPFVHRLPVQGDQSVAWLYPDAICGRSGNHADHVQAIGHHDAQDPRPFDFDVPGGPEAFLAPLLDAFRFIGANEARTVGLAHGRLPQRIDEHLRVCGAATEQRKQARPAEHGPSLHPSRAQVNPTISRSPTISRKGA